MKLCNILVWDWFATSIAGLVIYELPNDLDLQS